jgi:DNA-directed RNA polymerase subunit H (RpoH/RPB5)
MNISKPITYDKLNSMKVAGAGGLRQFVVNNKITKGISNLRKAEYIQRIMASDWWKTNGDGSKYPLPIKDSDLKKPKNVKECLAQKEKLRNEIQELEKKISDKNNTKEHEVLNTSLSDLIIESNTANNKELPEIDDTDDETDNKLDNTEGLITYKESEKRNIDIGNTAINIYTNGNYDPELPIPQKIVRQALSGNNLSLYKQQVIGDLLEIKIQQLQPNSDKKQPEEDRMEKIGEEMRKVIECVKKN